MLAAEFETAATAAQSVSPAAWRVDDLSAPALSTFVQFAGLAIGRADLSRAASGIAVQEASRADVLKAPRRFQGMPEGNFAVGPMASGYPLDIRALGSSFGVRSQRVSSRRRCAADTAAFSARSAFMPSSKVCSGRFALWGSRAKTNPISRPLSGC